VARPEGLLGSHRGDVGHRPEPNPPAKQETPRDRALRRAALAFMEEAVERRMGREMGLSPDAYRLIMDCARSVTRSTRERDDFLGQAWTIADSSVAGQWDLLAPLATASGVRFGGLEDLPADLVGRPFHAFPEKSSPALSGYDVGAQHLVAHAVVGAALTGRPMSVGFSGFTVPGSTANLRQTVQIMLAGNATEALVAGQIDSFRECECRLLARDFIMKALGIPAPPTPGSLAAHLESLSRAQEFHDYYAATFAEADALVRLALESGFMAAEADRLMNCGRISVDPATAAQAIQRVVPETATEQRMADSK
jgi:hypothetical protein